MKALKVFVAAVLLSVCSLAGSDSVEIINLKYFDEVNSDKFTIVAKGSGYQAGDNLTIKVIIMNNTTGEATSETMTVITK